MSQPLLLRRAWFRTGVLSAALTAVVWSIVLLPRPRSQTSEALATSLATPYWVYAFVPVRAIHALAPLVGGASEQTVPPPFTLWLRYPSLSIGREAVASVLIAIIATLLYGTLWQVLTKISPPQGTLFVIAMAMALILVVARIPASMLWTPPSTARIADQIGRTLTAPTPSILTLLHVPVSFGRPGDTPTPILTIAETYGAYAWVTCFLYWLPLAFLSFCFTRWCRANL
jgi:hypothetical protein